MANPPSGTVTFLFTDIEGSTALHDNYPDQMYAALERHDGILRDAIEANGGYVFSTGGDAFCAAFASARDAVRAALSAQRALSAEAWPENAEIRVRMGLHTGAAEERDGNYYGSPLNRTARLMSAGHGGQVLLSGATYNLVRDHLGRLESAAELRDLGEHRLRDLKFTEHVFQLVVPDLPGGFPPLRTAGLVTPRAELIDLDRRFGRVRHVGGGGMGDVYLAHHEALDRDMALKVLKKQYVNDRQFVERFKREARSAASLSHPNIAAIHDAGEGVFEGEKTPYIAMEYVPGGTLKDLILQQREPLPQGTAVELTLQVARALEAAHKRGVIHRDIKPQNILLTEDGAAKVVDFGIARAAASSTTLTQAGGMLGTPHYISPEQVMGESATPRSDLYALGVVLYEMLTGTLPFDAETPVGIVMKHVNAPLRAPNEANPEVPEELNAVCEWLLVKDPDERYQSASELVEDLERIRQGRPPAFLAARQLTTEPEKRDRYERIRPIGEGTTTEVFLARDTETNREVALKVLKDRYAKDEEVAARFKRGAKNAASLSHPNIAAVYDQGESGDGVPYVAMEYVSGGTLKERLRDDGPLPAPEAIALAAWIAGALGAAHEKGVIHRDVRPENVLLTEGGIPKVADFGIARTESETVLTQEGEVLGSAHYVSPEQALGQPLGPRSDLYSLGVVLYEMLTGVLPFDAASPVEVVMAHIRDEPHPPKDVNPEVPDGLNTLVLRLLSKDPEERYPGARALVEELETAAQGAGMPRDGRAEPDEEVADEKGRVRVPDLAGLNRFEAERSLDAVGLKLGATSETQSDAAGKDKIVGQNPAAGTKTDQGSSVSVTLGTGPVAFPKESAADDPDDADRNGGAAVAAPARVRVPELAGRYSWQASDALEGAGLGYDGRNRVRSDAPKDTVIGQNPSAGTEVARDSTVAVTISAGRRRAWPALLVFGLMLGGVILVVLVIAVALRTQSTSTLDVPDLEGKTQTEAEDLAGNDFEIDVSDSRASSTEPEGNILSQDPNPGEQAEQGSTISVVLSSGPSTSGESDTQPGSGNGDSQPGSGSGASQYGSGNGDSQYGGGAPGDVVCPSGGGACRGTEGIDSIIGSDTDDDINAGGAPDDIKAGDGNDTIDTSGDGPVDTVDCGNGTDTVTADQWEDVVNCESVTRV